jgi:hypothetical protein
MGLFEFGRSSRAAAQRESQNGDGSIVDDKTARAAIFVEALRDFISFAVSEEIRRREEASASAAEEEETDRKKH